MDLIDLSAAVKLVPAFGCLVLILIMDLAWLCKQQCLFCCKCTTPIIPIGLNCQFFKNSSLKRPEEDLLLKHEKDMSGLFKFSHIFVASVSFLWTSENI